jgi:hypothetical protein
MTFKQRFLQNPQQDSEGFTNYTAQCLGCHPDDMCPRSGHCTSYDQRHHVYGIPAWIIEQRELVATADKALDHAGDLHEVPMRHYDVPEACETEADAKCDGCKPEVTHPWAQLDQDQLDRVHTLWVQGKVKPAPVQSASAECPQTDRCANLHHIECGCAALGD